MGFIKSDEARLEALKVLAPVIAQGTTVAEIVYQADVLSAYIIGGPEDVYEVVENSEYYVNLHKLIESMEQRYGVNA